MLTLLFRKALTPGMAEPIVLSKASKFSFCCPSCKEQEET